MKNFIVRALTGIIFVSIIIGAICFHPLAYVCVFGGVVALILHEFYRLIEHYEETQINCYSNCVSGVYLFVASFVYASGWIGSVIFYPYLLYLIYVFVGELYYKRANPINNWAFSFLGQIFYVVPFSLMNFIVFTKTESGMLFTPILLFSIFVFVWMNDTGAFLVGSLFGKHRLFKRISPKKSWEGFYGGLVFALASSFAFYYFFPDIEWYKWLGLSLVIVIFGTWGDLTESLLKRTLGVKDSGHILPGHGGLLDRFDSVTMAVPVAFVYIQMVIRH